MVNLTNPDVEWLNKLLEVCKEKQAEYPEIFSDAQDEIILIAQEILS